MKVRKTPIEGVLIFEPRVHEDDRGFFYESYNQAIFSKHGVSENFVQDNHVRSSKGVLRGLHFQRPPRAQAKLLRVIRGSILDVAVDLRKGSATYGQHVAVELSEANRLVLYVPAGFAHGYCALADGTETLYKVSDLYSPGDEGGVLWNDPALKIQWPDLGQPYRVSPKDDRLPRLHDLLPL